MTIWEFIKYSFLLLWLTIIVVMPCLYFGLSQDITIVIGVVIGVIAVEIILYRRGM